MKNPHARRYVPLMWDLTDKTILVVGGGQAALQKIRALVVFQAPVTAVAPRFTAGLEELAAQHPGIITLVCRPFLPADLDQDARGLVYACTDDLELNLKIVTLCRQKSLAVCDASQPDRGDFLSAASLVQGDFILSVSSGGRDLKGAVAIRNRLKESFEKAASRPEML